MTHQTFVGSRSWYSRTVARTLRHHARNAKLIFSITVRREARSAGLYSQLKSHRRRRRRQPVESEVSSNECRNT